jgi:peptidoglycan-associated lipoprotein
MMTTAHGKKGMSMARPRLAAIFAIVAAFTLAACSSAVKLDDTAPIEGRSGMGPGGAAGAGADASASERAVAQVTIDAARDPIDDPNNPLSRRSVFFDFDSFTIREEFRPLIELHARYLVANKTRKVVVQGNTDERGSREYNLALGQKRAEAVRRAMLALGVAESQIEAVSFGEEKPRAVGTDEASYAENRRADLAYQ